MYNPYDPVEVIVNGQKMFARPIEFDSEIADPQTSNNAFGYPVKPTKLSATCPDCGSGLEIEVILDDPPFDTIVYNCHYCRPAPEPLPDPFTNPVDTGRVATHELDPLLHNPDEEVLETATTVAERVSPEEIEEIPPVDDSHLAKGVSEELVNLLDENDPEKAPESPEESIEEGEDSDVPTDEETQEGPRESSEDVFDDSDLEEP
jgi:hypothetical protein